jgi:3'(2'), 5'-bisphosphate nucleotidase
MGFDFLTTAREAALAAGARIMRYYRGGFSVSTKEDQSPVTEADREADDIIRRVLAPAGFPVISEETAPVPYSVRKQWTEAWMVDPLDGTKEFVKKTDEFCINIAFLRHGQPVYGLVFIPVSGILYAADGRELIRERWTADGSGLYGICTEKTVLRDVNPSYDVCSSVSHGNRFTQEFIRHYLNAFPQGNVLRAGSALKFGWMVEGRAGIYPRFSPTSEWDTAAGHALLRAAGGDVVDADTLLPLVYNRESLLNPPFVAFMPHLHPVNGAFRWPDKKP